jgi:hypothetical protein
MAGSNLITRPGIVRSNGGQDILMVRILYALSILAIISASVLSVHCGYQWIKYEPQSRVDSEISIEEKFRQSSSHGKKSNEPALSPLVRQAQAFALYLNPPKPPKPKVETARKSEPKKVAVKLPKIEPKFRLLSTSYYRSNPEKSLALVSEPGKGTHWVGAGEDLGHFRIEEIRKGMILFRQDDRILQMAIDTKVPVIRPTEASETALASNKKEDKTEQVRTRPRQQKSKTPKPFFKLGPRRSQTRTVVLDHEKIGSG